MGANKRPPIENSDFIPKSRSIYHRNYEKCNGIAEVGGYYIMFKRNKYWILDEDFNKICYSYYPKTIEKKMVKLLMLDEEEYSIDNYYETVRMVEKGVDSLLYATKK